MTDIPADIMKRAADAIIDGGGSVTMRGELNVAVARAIMAEREATEARTVAILQDPAGVYVNWLIGHINADVIIRKERERCAKIVENWQEQLVRGEFIPTAIERLASAIRSERAGE